MKRILILLPLLAVVSAGSIFLFALSQTQAVQAPKISIDMDPTGNTYIESVDTDFDGVPESGNVMTVGTIDNCLTSIPGNNAEHSHPVQLIVQDVEDLIGFQARINFDGTRAAPANFDLDPFNDAGLGQQISFTNLPIEIVGGVGIGHHQLFPSSEILNPTAANGTAFVSAAALGTQTLAVSPDVPEKSPHDEATRTYTVTGGGVLASFDFVTRAGQDGQQSLLLDVDDANPTAPGSEVVYFDGTSQQTIAIGSFNLFDGHHGEGVQCVALAQETPPPATDTPTPTPAPGQPTPTPGPGSGGGATPTRTPARGAATPAASPAALPPTGGTGDGLWTGYTLVLVAALAASASGAAFGMWRLRRR